MKRPISILAIVLAGSACAPAAAQAAFGLSEFDASFTESDAGPALRAGSHPFALTTSLEMNANGGEPDGRLRDLVLREPAGLVANTAATPGCTDDSFGELVDGVNACPNGTAVGVVESEFGAAGHRAADPVFDLVPHEGQLMRLGFRVSESANVVMDLTLNPAAPYDLVATIHDMPEAADIFGLRLTLWGVPGAREHDSLRGHCLGPGGESLGECPTGVGEVPLFTLPTRCDGPLETSYEARSWAGEWASGNALTHDGSGEPSGATGCGDLAFDPFLAVEPTTKAAVSPSGLHLSLDMFDEGLDNPRGFAESQAREAVVALPEGMEADLPPAGGNDVCSETQLADETLEAEPGEGCPEGSGIGTVELDSPLVEEPVGGVIYRAVPYANPAATPLAVYVVLKSPKLGILVKQPVWVEQDLETGELIGVAEDLPQLPFSKFDLHLPQSDGGPLVSPPRCGIYTTDGELTPWAGEPPISVSSSFMISTGPGGGPCPTGGGEPEARTECGACRSAPPPSAGPPPAAVAPAASVRRHRAKRRCVRGKRGLHRDGKGRCPKAGHRRRG